MKKERAVVAMSGGVDSSVAAALLVEQGFETIGVTLQLLPGAPTGFGCCGSPADIADAKAVASRLNIPHYVVTTDELFEDKVIRPFVESYLQGDTPNPCALCNRFVKFGHLLGLSQAWNARFLATGHYARVQDGKLYRARDENKDQTYFLYNLGSRELSRLIFPVGELSKPEVRNYARRLGLETAEKPESQEICFIPNRDYRGFVKSHPLSSQMSSALKSGPIKDVSGKEIGRHEGTVGYTIGQRKGLVAGLMDPKYVVRLDPQNQTVIVGEKKETMASSFEVSDMSWTCGRPISGGRAEVRIRHRHAPASSEFLLTESGRVRVHFDSPQRAITPGQSAVLYHGTEVVGGGTIREVLR